MDKRTALIKRETKETSIELYMDLDGGDVEISTSVGFFDHMLTLFAYHGGFGLKVSASGDIHIDGHHIVEDIGIVMGRALYDAAGDKAGIRRYGQCLLPMDETLVEAAVDFSGRSFLHFDLEFKAAQVGTFDLQLVEEFFRAFTANAKITLHVMKRHGANDHHVSEAAFKGVARALRQALEITSCRLESTKGVIE